MAVVRVKAIKSQWYSDEVEGGFFLASDQIAIDIPPP